MRPAAFPQTTVCLAPAGRACPAPTVFPYCTIHPAQKQSSPPDQRGAELLHAVQRLDGVAADAADADIVAAALAEPKIAKLADGMELVKSIVVKGRLVNLAVKG